MSEFVDRFSVTDESGNIKKEININFGDPLAREQSQKAVQTSEQAKQIAQEAKDTIPAEVSKRVEEVKRELSGEIEEATRELSGEIEEAQQTADEAKQIAGEAKETADNVLVKSGVIQWTTSDVLNNLLIGVRISALLTSRPPYKPSDTFRAIHTQGEPNILLKSVNSYQNITVPEGFSVENYYAVSPPIEIKTYFKNLKDVDDFSIDFNFTNAVLSDWTVEIGENLENLKSSTQELSESGNVANSTIKALLTFMLTGEKFSTIYTKIGNTTPVISYQSIVDTPNLFALNKEVTDIVFLDCQRQSLNSIFGSKQGTPSPYDGRKLMPVRRMVLANIGSLHFGCYNLMKLEEFVLLGKNDFVQTSLSNAFAETKIDELDLSSCDFSQVTSYQYAFTTEGHLRTIVFNQEKLAEVNVSSTRGMFAKSIVEVVDLSFLKNVSLTNSAENMFYSCQKMHTLLLPMDFSLCGYVTQMFTQAYALENFSGLKNIRISINLGSCKSLTHESALNCIAGLYDLTEGGTVTDYTAQTLTFHADVKAQLSEEEIAEATAKGWNIA